MSKVCREWCTQSEKPAGSWSRPVEVGRKVSRIWKRRHSVIDSGEAECGSEFVKWMSILEMLAQCAFRLCIHSVDDSLVPDAPSQLSRWSSAQQCYLHCLHTVSLLYHYVSAAKMCNTRKTKSAEQQKYT